MTRLSLTCAAATSILVGACINFEAPKFKRRPGLEPAPVIVSIEPEHGTVDVPVTSSITYRFSKPMNVPTVTLFSEPALELSQPLWDQADQRVTYLVTVAMSYSTEYTIEVNGQDGLGQPIEGVRTATFTTMAPPVVSLSAPPVIDSTNPPNGATVVPLDSKLSVTFSRPVVSAGLALEPNVSLSEPVITNDGKTYEWTPTSPLLDLTGFVATVAASDDQSQLLAGTTTFSFTTAPIPDTAPPAVVSRIPAPGAALVPPNTILTVSFSEPVKTPSVVLLVNSAPCTVNVSTDRQSASCTTANLPAGQPVTAKVQANLEDDTGNKMAADDAWTFDTSLAPDTMAPTVDMVTPAAGDKGVAPSTNLVIEFSEPMNFASTAGALSVKIGATPVAGAISWNLGGDVLTFNPSSDFAKGVTVTWTVSTAAKDATNINALQSPATGTFRVMRNTTVTINSVGTLDGYIVPVADCSEGSLAFNTGVGMMIGDGGPPNNCNYQGFVSFNLFDLFLPLSDFDVAQQGNLVTVQTAELWLFWDWKVGSPSGNMRAYSVDYGSGLDTNDYDASAVPAADAVNECLGPGGCSLPQSLIYRFDPVSSAQGFRHAQHLTLNYFNVAPKVKLDWSLRLPGQRAGRSQWRIETSPRGGVAGSEQIFLATGESTGMYPPSGRQDPMKPRLIVNFDYP
ncbi:MAG: Ig-like domain-containing protein [Deltaproteobacteria bacterium]|nr:Ig-like domain-containing protein [Deltaproteobacteria bacterium]